MPKREGRNQKIVRLAIERFSSVATPDTIEKVVRFSIKKRNELVNAKQREIGDDARDYLYTASLILSLPDKYLRRILKLKPREIQRGLKKGSHPFWKLDKKTREKLLHLPVSWIKGGADFILQDRYEYK